MEWISPVFSQYGCESLNGHLMHCKHCEIAEAALVSKRPEWLDQLHKPCETNLNPTFNLLPFSIKKLDCSLLLKVQMGSCKPNSYLFLAILLMAQL